MTDHRIGTREEWLAARLELLQAEKEHTRRGDELAKQRQELPWVRVEKEYTFDTDEGSASLADLFRGRSQLLMYHFMFGPEYTGGCPVCSTIADGFNGFVVHLENHDVGMMAVSQAPLETLQEYKRRMGWAFPWASSFGSDFNFDFHVSSTPERPLEEYNFRALTGEPRYGELPGMSAFALEDGQVFRTYSAYSRGVDVLWGFYQWLDRAPRGRNEDGGSWFRRHDEYPAAV